MNVDIEPKHPLTLSFIPSELGEGTKEELEEFAAYCECVAEAVCERAGIDVEFAEESRFPSSEERDLGNTIFNACCSYPDDSDAAIDDALRALGYSTEV